MLSKHYDRTMRHHSLVSEEGEARDALHDVIQSMSALAWMTRCMLISDIEETAGPAFADGVYKLFDQQCAMLNGIFEELGEEEERRAKENEAKGAIKQERIPTEALVSAAHKLRVDFIASNTKAGVEAGLIGAALNLSNADVERVVSRLRGEAAPAPKTAARRAGGE